MKILVCGAGVVGLSIARQLVSEENDVIIIDDNPENIRRAEETVDASARIGFPSHPPVLEEAGAATADMIIAVTPSDEVNMIICEVAHSLFAVPVKIARIRHTNYLMPIWKELYRQDHLSIDHIISPEHEVAKTILNDLALPGAMEMIPFADGAMQVVEVRCELSCPVIGRNLKDLREDLRSLRANILTLFRDDKHLLYADAETIRVDDAVFFVVDKHYVKTLMSYFGHNEKAAQRVLVIGGGNIGLTVVSAIEAQNSGVAVTVIERNRDRAIHIADRVQTTHVVHGDALDEEILSEAKIDQTDTLIAVTNDDEVNILVSLLAKRHGCSRVMSLINKNTSYSILTRTLGIDVIINPREMTVSTILQHIRRGKVRAAHYICTGKAEVIEAEIVKQSTVIGRSIDDLNLPKGALVSALLRDGAVIIPDATTIIMERDRLLIFCLVNQIKKVDTIFADRITYFS